MDAINIKRGQIWKENDARFPNSFKKIIEVSRKTSEVKIRTCCNEGLFVKGSIERWFKMERFDGRGSGYSLFKDAA